MHHKNHHNSTQNFNNPQHHKNNNRPEYPSGPSPGGRYGGGYPTKPVPSTSRKPSVLSKIRDKFKEKPATKEQVAQLKLDAEREVYKTRKAVAKKARPSRFDFFSGGGSSGGGGRRSSGGGRRVTRQDNGGSFLFSGDSSMGNDFFSGGGEGPSLDMFKWDSGKKPKSKKNQRDGISDLFT